MRFFKAILAGFSLAAALGAGFSSGLPAPAEAQTFRAGSGPSASTIRGRSLNATTRHARPRHGHRRSDGFRAGLAIDGPGVNIRLGTGYGGRYHRPGYRRYRDRYPGYLGRNGVVFYRDDEPELPPAPRAEPPPPPPPEPAEVTPPEPPDPRGAVRKVARGVAADTPFTVGEALPEGLPHVTLDWRVYDLPEPPAGLIYARVGRTVLLISPEDRIVERVVEPG